MERDIQKVITDGHFSTRAAGGDFTGVTGTGIGGRVTTYDIDARRAVSGSSGSSSAAPDFEEIKLTNIRKVIANAMHKSLSEGAQLTLHSSFDATDVINFRENLKAIDGRENGSAQAPRSTVKITVTDIITFAASRVLLNHRSINAHFLGDRMALYNRAHIGVAVDTPRGLLVPTIFNADSLTLTELSAQAKTLFEKCRQGAIEPDALKGGTFTVSNLGGLGIEMFTPILNPPQTGLLGVCSAVERTKEGKIYPAIGLSLTFDHRALDGADAARFLKDLVRYLERFSANLAIEGAL